MWGIIENSRSYTAHFLRSQVLQTPLNPKGISCTRNMSFRIRGFSQPCGVSLQSPWTAQFIFVVLGLTDDPTTQRASPAREISPFEIKSYS